MRRLLAISVVCLMRAGLTKLSRQNIGGTDQNSTRTLEVRRINGCMTINEFQAALNISIAI